MSKSSISFSTTVAGFGAAAFLFIAVLADGSQVQAQSATSAAASIGPRHAYQFPPQHLPDQKAVIKAGDQIAVLKAIDVALTQAADGATYVWKRDSGRINGSVRMTSTFRDADGRICRHLELMLTSGTFSRQTEGIACRQQDGVWDLEG